MSDAYKEISGVYPAPKTLKGSIAGSGKLVGNIFVTDLIHGKSAYQIALENGFEGTEQEWLDSLAEEANTKAMTYANEAEESAQRANLAASVATEKEQSAIKAKGDAERASYDANVFARDAEGYSVVAATSANDAKSSAETASSEAVQATARAEEARAFAESALNSATIAAASEYSAQEYSRAASAGATAAERYKTQAETAKSDAETAKSDSEKARDDASVFARDAEGHSAAAEGFSKHAEEVAGQFDNAIGYVNSKAEEVKKTAIEVKADADRAEEAVTTGKDAAIADIEEAVKDGKDAAIMALDAREQAIIDSLPDTYTELYNETEKKPDVESNIIEQHKRLTFQGPGTYLYRDFYVDDPEMGMPYSIFVGSIENSPINETGITFLDKDGKILKKLTKRVAVNSHLHGVPVEGTARIKFTCYATQSGGLSETPAYYNDVYIFKGYEITRDLPSIAVSNVHSATIARMIPSSTVKTIAHRGLCNRFVTQNSRSAYIECRRMGYVCAENDIQITSDGVYVMCHETDLSRQDSAVEDITGKRLYMDSAGEWYWYDTNNQKLYTYENGGYIESGVALSSLTRAEGKSIKISQTPYSKLKRVNMGKPDDNLEQIETFEEWIYLMKCLGMGAYVDCKMSFTADQWSYLVNVVRKLGMLRYVTWIVSWEDKDKLRAADPHARFGLTWTLTDSQMEALRAYTANGEVIYYGTSEELTEAIASKARECGLILECWYVPNKNTTDEEHVEAIKNAVSLGVDAIATDFIRVEDLFSNVGTSTSGTPVILQGGSGGGVGENGTTFIPHVSPEGVISWTNDGGRDNPEPVNIKGGDGKNAYEYAKDGGYTGTEAEFSAKLAKKIPEKTSELKNDSEYIKASGAPVQTVNNKTGNVTLDASDVGARPDTWMPNASEVGARPATWTPTASEVGARPNTWTPTYSDVGADKSGTAASAVSTHNTNNAAHNDIRLLIEGLTARINAIANSTDEDLDQMAEIVAYIKANKSLIDSITTSKVSVSDIVDNLTTNVKDKPLSAAQGVALKALIDAITVPTKVSELENDAKYLTSFTEADPTVPSWAKQTNKPSYSKSEVGLSNVDNVKQYSASNPPPYPVTSVNGKTGAVTLDAAAVGARPSTWTPSASEVGALPASTTIPTKTSQLKNDSNFAVTTKAETWTFELEDGSTVTKKVVLD